jgi:hypothetical protein
MIGNKITLTVMIDTDSKDVHITDNHMHSCNYSDIDGKFTAKGIGECVTEHLKDYFRAIFKE